MASQFIPSSGSISPQGPFGSSQTVQGSTNEWDSIIFDRSVLANETITSSRLANNIYKTMIVSALSDQAGTIYIDESPNGTDWYLGVATVGVLANTLGRTSTTIGALFSRVRYVNGGSLASRVLVSCRRSGD